MSQKHIFLSSDIITQKLGECSSVKNVKNLNLDLFMVSQVIQIHIVISISLHEGILIY